MAIEFLVVLYVDLEVTCKARLVPVVFFFWGGGARGWGEWGNQVLRKTRHKEGKKI